MPDSLCTLGPDVPGSPWLGPVHEALASALAGGAAGSAHVRLSVGGRDLGSLRLVLGDARETLPRLADRAVFHAVFLDAFSPARQPELWTPTFLGSVARRLAPGGRLSTYTTATRVRAALVAAGLTVGPGPVVGTRAEGTVARRGGEVPPFEPRVARRIERAARTLGPVPAVQD